MPSILSGSATGSSPTQVAIGISSGTLIIENYNRVGLTVVNISTGTIYIGIGNTAVLGSGISLVASGGVWVMDEYTYSKENIYAIAHSANSAVAVQEFVIRS